MADRPDADGEQPTDRYAAAFDLVGEETRLGIVRELARAQAADPHAPALPFSVLRERLGTPDSGTFNYHLSRLRGQFVHKDDAGYQLTPAGHRLAAAVAAGAFGSEQAVETRALDEACPACDAQISASYEEGVLTVACANGHGLRNLFPGGAFEGRDIEGVRSLFDRVTRQQVDLALAGDCPLCYARTDRTLLDGDHSGDLPVSEDGTLDPEQDGWRVEAVCRRCGAVVSVPVGLGLDGHPVISALLTAVGRDPRERHIWGDGTVEYGIESTSLPLDVRATVDGATARFSVDEGWAVTTTETPEWLSWPADD